MRLVNEYISCRAALAVLMFASVAGPVHAGPGTTPELRFRIESSNHPEPLCFNDDQQIIVTVELGPADSIINGGQFVVLYDPGCLSFDSAAPGGDPYVMELYENNDAESGTLIYAIGVQLGGVGIMGDADLAILTLTKESACNDCALCFGGENPANTYLTDELGHAVLVDTFCSDAIGPGGLTSVTIPDSDVVEAECEGQALVTWDEPEAVSTCGLKAFGCEGRHVEQDLAYNMGTIFHGGSLDVGTSSFCCTATNLCGFEEQACWTVVVNPPPVAAPVPDELSKNRYLSFMAEPSDEPMGYRVTLVQVDGFPGTEGRSYWIGHPAESPDAVGNDTFIAAPMQCSPYFTDWPVGESIHVFGAAIVPESIIAIQSIRESCNPSDASSFSAPVYLSTGQWGDVNDPFVGAGFDDVTAIVAAFQANPDSLPKRFVQLQPATPNPQASVSFADVSISVDAVKGHPYPYAGPQVCP